MSILDNLNSLSKKAQGYADIAVDKAKDLAEVAADKAKTATNTAKLNMAILSEQRELEKNYRAIGEWFISEYTGEIPDAVKDVVAAVNASKAHIAEMEAEKAAYKAEPVVEEETIGVKVCPVCGAVSEDKFCPHCGAPMGDYAILCAKKGQPGRAVLFCAYLLLHPLQRGGDTHVLQIRQQGVVVVPRHGAAAEGVPHGFLGRKAAVVLAQVQPVLFSLVAAGDDIAVEVTQQGADVKGGQDAVYQTVNREIDLSQRVVILLPVHAQLFALLIAQFHNGGLHCLYIRGEGGDGGGDVYTYGEGTVLVEHGGEEHLHGYLGGILGVQCIADLCVDLLCDIHHTLPCAHEPRTFAAAAGGKTQCQCQCQ